MSFSIVVGSQWGDEGKGRVVDLLAEKADFVARYYGGDNAGHTVTVGERTFKLHLIPSGVIQPHTTSLLGNGMVINPLVLREEMGALKDAGVDVSPDRVKISFAAHLITPGHRALDKAREKARGDEKIGTTQRGIGPAYTTKVIRSGLRMEGMLNPSDFRLSVEKHIEGINIQLRDLYDMEPLNASRIADQYKAYAEEFSPYVADVGSICDQALQADKHLLAEGAQGTLLDLDHGTYPFVTSSTPTAPGALVGLGIGLGSVDKVIGVAKAFQTRVGEGPFPTEVFEDIAQRLRGTGEHFWDEFGTTTGRPRRVGWLDSVLLRYASRINGLSELVLTKLDILSGLDSLRICSAYKRDGEMVQELPLGPGDLSPFEPDYVDLPGWEEDIMDVRAWKDLPEQAKDYVAKVEELSGLPCRLISVGPERDQIIRR